MGQPCTEIFIVLNGVMDIVLTDGYDHQVVMDVLGRGSVLGVNNIIKGEQWYYECVNSNLESNKCLSLPWSAIHQVM